MGKTGYSVRKTKEKRNYRIHEYQDPDEKLISARMKEVFHLIKEEDPSITQKDLAQLLHVRHQRVSDYLGGKIAVPRAFLFNFAVWSEESHDFLVGRTDISLVKERQHRELLELEKEHKRINEQK